MPRSTPRPPIAVAITGAIGAGKSTALDAFRAHGAATVSSDEIVHHLLASDDDVRAALAAYHAGQGNVDEWRREGVGIQFPETRDYVGKVLEAQRVYADAYADELG